MAARIREADLASVQSLPNERTEKIENHVALGLLHAHTPTGMAVKDPTHIQLQRQWFQAIAYAAGYTNRFYGQPYNEDYMFEEAFQNAYYSANHIGRMVRGEVARLTRARPSMEVVPNSSEQRDVYGARAAQQVADWLYYDSDAEERRDDLALWLACCGTAFDFHGWEPRFGEKRTVFTSPYDGSRKNEDQLSTDELSFYQSLGEDSREELRDGDFDNETLSAFQVRVPLGPSMTHLDKMPWVCFTRLMSLDEIWDRWPAKAKDINEEEAMMPPIAGYYWRHLCTLFSAIGNLNLSRGQSYLEGIEVCYYIRPPSERFPKGIYVVGIESQDLLLENGPHPYETQGVKMRFPLTDYHHTKVAGRYWSKGIVEDLQGPQEDYNIGRQQEIVQRHHHSKRQWLAARRANLTSRELTGATLMEYDSQYGGGPPMPVDPSPMSQQIAQGREAALNDMQTLAAQSEASQGQVPEGVRSGVALQSLQQRDEMVTVGTHGRMERSFQRSMRARLMLFSKFVKAERRIEIYGEGRQADLVYLRGEDIANNTRLRIMPGSMFPRSKAQQQALFLDAVQAGVFDHPDPELRRYALQVLEMGALQTVFTEIDGHSRRANQENDRFERGRPPFPDVDEDDDHLAHMRRHMILKVSDTYEKMSQVRKLAFDRHLALHRQYYAQIAMAPMMMQGMQAAQQGGVPGQPQQQGSPPRELGKPSPPKAQQRQPQE